MTTDIPLVGESLYCFNYFFYEHWGKAKNGSKL